MNALKRQSLGTALAASLTLLLGLQACGDDSDDNPTPPDVVTTGGTKAQGGANSTAGKGGKSGTGGTGNGEGGGGNEPSGGTQPVAGGGQGGEGPEPEPECTLPELGEDGCFNCPRNREAEQWLNRCVESDCEPFDNKARLPLLNEDGSLPELP
jgi:hypothetical protein